MDLPATHITLQRLQRGAMLLRPKPFALSALNISLAAKALGRSVRTYLPGTHAPCGLAWRAFRSPGAQQRHREVH